MNTINESKGGLSEIAASQYSQKRPAMKQLITAALALWFGLVFFLGARGAFIAPAGSPPLPIFLGVAIPLAVFFAAYFVWSEFRAFVLSADLRFVTAMQAWRWAGSGFLLQYAHGVLPALFAFPAGLGDMAVGFTAPWIVFGLVRQRSFATSRRFVIWNIMGITDFIIAVSMGTICSGFFPAFAGPVTSSPMAYLPLILIPAFFVPLFTMLHSIALLQARQSRP